MREALSSKSHSFAVFLSLLFFFFKPAPKLSLRRTFSQPRPLFLLFYALACTSLCISISLNSYFYDRLSAPKDSVEGCVTSICSLLRGLAIFQKRYPFPSIFVFVRKRTPDCTEITKETRNNCTNNGTG